MSQDKNKLVKRYKSITFMITYLKVYFTIGFRIRHKRRKYGIFFFLTNKCGIILFQRFWTCVKKKCKSPNKKRDKMKDNLNVDREQIITK